MLVAGDTFRAGAVNQLKEWADRLNVSFYGDDRKDPSAVIYDGVSKAKDEHYDLVLVDTAGRLQNKTNLMKELEKMMDAHLAQLSDTEKHVVDLSQQLEAKYDAFVAKLEATNMDQLYKYCQDMSKSINTKLGIALGGVAVAVIISIISLFI